VLSSYPPDIFKSIFTLFISFLSILSLLETRQTPPAALLKAPVWEKRLRFFWETPRVNVGNTTSSYGEHLNKVWETPRVTMGNTPGSSTVHIPVDNFLILLVAFGASCQYVGDSKTPTR